MNRTIAIIILAILRFAGSARAGDFCEVCGVSIEKGTLYLYLDKMANVRKRVCHNCVELTTVCYLCGMPVKEKYEELPDGRILCARDVKNVVLDEDEAQRIWQDVKDTVERQHSRFMSFPDNVTIHPLDRVDLQEMFKVVGNDFTCPNVWGCTLRETNDSNRVNFKISLLRGLPPSVLKGTCAHELTHTWVSENLSRQRRLRVSGDAEEGFCELIACLYAESQGDQAQIGIIKSNGYTRGQFALFREAERQFGMNDVVEWMKYGVDARLIGDDLVRVRKIETPVAMKSPPPPASTAALLSSVAPPPPPETLTLKGVLWSTRPSAIINDRTFMVNEVNKVRLGSSNIVVRCISISQDSVIVQVAGSGEQQTLKLTPPDWR